MEGKRLERKYFAQSAVELAPDLIGKLLCRKMDGQVLRYRIMETECYYSEQDTACHASKGRTERTKVLYMQGGTAYVYLCYGIHSLFNVVTGNEGFPEAVLIRGVEGYNGPGKLTKAMGIDRKLNEVDMTTSGELWIEDDGERPTYRADKRVGIDYAEEKDREMLWRYIIENGSYRPVK